MMIIFCEDPMAEGEPDSMYIDEIAAATRAGLDHTLIDYKALTEEKNPARAVQHIKVHPEPERAVYRGWSLHYDEYTTLYDALLSRGIQLINSPAQYKHCHHLPESLHIIEPMTPRTVWIETEGDVSYQAIIQMLMPFAGRRLVLRDFVKSEKNYWQQACFISSASDETAVKNTIDHFLKLRGDDLRGGLVFREFIDFQPLTERPTGGMPLVNEYRIFYLNGAPVQTVRYWNVDDVDDVDEPPLEQFTQIAGKVRSRFFTMDVAQTTDGDWMIIELDDGQVAGLPASADENRLYQALSSL